MNLELVHSIDRKAWLEALHAKGSSDMRLTLELDEAEKMLMASARPKAVYKLMKSAELKAGGDSVRRHLEGCFEVVLMAVTLGIEVDNIIRKTQITDMAKAVILDTGASILIEQQADEFEAYIRQQLKDNIYMTSRFSPGYGDWSVTEQQKIIHMLDASRRVGLNVTKDSLMIPRKSITAVIGIADHPVSGSLATCSECVLKDKCELRKQGGFCGDRF